MSATSHKKAEFAPNLPASVARPTAPNLNGKNLRIALVVSRFNSDISAQMTEICTTRLVALGVNAENIAIVSVPGAVEVPFALKQTAKNHQPNAIIALGAIIKGETDHYQYVCQQVTDSIATLNLKLNIPIIFGILTAHTKAQANARTNLATNYAENAIEMANLSRTA